MSITVCATCKHCKILPGDREKHWRWMCECEPLPSKLNFVTGVEAADPPFARCVNRNYGSCAEYEPGPTVVHPREMAHGNA